jgi:hypothetical protein
MNNGTDSSDLQRLMTTDEAAAYLRLAPSTLNKMRVYGGGPAFLKLTRGVRYEFGELLKWQDTRRFHSTSQYLFRKSVGDSAPESARPR